jgi:hypothetical protein
MRPRALLVARTTVVVLNLVALAVFTMGAYREQLRESKETSLRVFRFGCIPLNRSLSESEYQVELQVDVDCSGRPRERWFVLLNFPAFVVATLAAYIPRWAGTSQVPTFIGVFAAAAVLWWWFLTGVLWRILHRWERGPLGPR